MATNRKRVCFTIGTLFEVQIKFTWFFGFHFNKRLNCENRRILSMGAHSCELFCNLGLCCLYGGQLDLVFPCFQRAIRLATTPEQRADVWYNLSFVALVCFMYSK